MTLIKQSKVLSKHMGIFISFCGMNTHWIPLAFKDVAIFNLRGLQKFIKQIILILCNSTFQNI